MGGVTDEVVFTEFASSSVTKGDDRDDVSSHVSLTY